MNAAVDKRAVQSLKRAARKASLSKRLGKEETDPSVLELLKRFEAEKEDDAEEEE